MTELAPYGRYRAHYEAVRPGCSGAIWQVCGSRDVSCRRRIAINVTYARKASLRLDLSITLYTIKVLTTSRGAY